MDEPREYTPDEVRDRFMDAVRGAVRFWQHNSNVPCDEKLGGVAHSILCIIDGVSSSMPAFDLIPTPHPDDEAFHRNEGENWVPSNESSDRAINGNDMLHELLYR